MKKILTILVTAVLFALAACSNSGYTDPSVVTVRYEQGASQGGKFVECVEPGKKIVTNDKLYPYPATQREDVWDSANYNAGSKSADHPDMELTDKDGNLVYVKMKVSFFLNTDCSPVTVNGKKYPGGALQVFHELIGKTRHAYFNKDGSYGDGWLWAMDNYLSSSVVDYMTKATRTETADVMWKTSAVSTDFAGGLADQLPALVNAGMETDLQFYKDFTVKIYSITPEAEYLNLYKDRQNAKIKAETAEANKAAAIAEAKAKAAVAEEEAKIREAQARGYGGYDNMLKDKAIDNGLNPWQPTYVVGGTSVR